MKQTCVQPNTCPHRFIKCLNGSLHFTLTTVQINYSVALREIYNIQISHAFLPPAIPLFPPFLSSSLPPFLSCSLHSFLPSFPFSSSSSSLPPLPPCCFILLLKKELMSRDSNSVRPFLCSLESECMSSNQYV